MKPVEEYMLFKHSDLEKVNAVNAQGVRSAPCSADFDEAWPEHDQLGSTHNGSFLIVSIDCNLLLSILYEIPSVGNIAVGPDENT